MLVVEERQKAIIDSPTLHWEFDGIGSGSAWRSESGRVYLVWEAKGLFGTSRGHHVISNESLAAADNETQYNDAEKYQFVLHKNNDTSVLGGNCLCHDAWSDCSDERTTSRMLSYG